jgi:hypothetical protein
VLIIRIDLLSLVLSPTSSSSSSSMKKKQKHEKAGICTEKRRSSVVDEGRKGSGLVEIYCTLPSS